MFQQNSASQGVGNAPAPDGMLLEKNVMSDDDARALKMKKNSAKNQALAFPQRIGRHNWSHYRK
jgi:hypothetical protein